MLIILTIQTLNTDHHSTANRKDKTKRAGMVVLRGGDVVGRIGNADLGMTQERRGWHWTTTSHLKVHARTNHRIWKPVLLYMHFLTQKKV